MNWRVTLALSTVCTAFGDDVAVCDLRLIASPLLGRSLRANGDVTQESQGVRVVTDGALAGTLERHSRFGIGHYRSFHELEAGRGSFLWGSELSWDDLRTDDDRCRSLLLDGFVGWAWALTPRWHVEQGALLGAGTAWWAIGLSEGNPDHDTSFSYEYGMRLGSYYTLHEGMQFGADLRYLVTTSRVRLNETRVVDGVTEHLSFDSSCHVDGLGGSVSLGWRF
jgi:hypothetical protein